VGDNDALGVGFQTPTATLAGGALVADGSDRTIANPISLAASSTLAPASPARPLLAFTNTLTVLNSATLTVNNNAPTTISNIAMGTNTLTIVEMAI